MSFFKEVNDAANLVIEKCGMSHKKVEDEEAHPCEKFMDPERMDDFAHAIAELMDNEGMSYEEAKATAFDETEVPKKSTACDKMLRKNVNMIRDGK